MISQERGKSSYVCCSVLQGLQYIHSMALVHLDIKPENIFLSLPDSNSPGPPLTCIAEESMGVDAPQPLYKIGRCNDRIDTVSQQLLICNYHHSTKLHVP